MSSVAADASTPVAEVVTSTATKLVPAPNSDIKPVSDQKPAGTTSSPVGICPLYRLAPPKPKKKVSWLESLRKSIIDKLAAGYLKDHKLSLVYLFLFHKWLEGTKGYDPAAVTLDKPVDAPEHEGGDGNKWRDVTGYGNLKELPLTGARGQPFNHSYPHDQVPPSVTKYDIMDPDPRVVSRELLQRIDGKAITASTVNTFCGAWIQFMTHDWMTHVKDSEREPLLPATGHQEAIPHNKVGQVQDGVPYYINDNCHWWQGPQIYGRTLEIQNALRTHADGKVKVFPQDPETGGDFVGAGSPNLWWGLTLLHILFTMEHNSICDMLKQHHPDWNDETLFQMARVINTGAIARIHVLEWTKAILDHPLAAKGQDLLWKGLLPFQIPRALRKGLLDSDDLFGKAGRPKANQHDCPFSHTEEFAHIYRMHPLMPDEFQIHAHETDGLLEKLPLEDAVFEKSWQFVNKYQGKWDDLVYSMGKGPVGLLTLNNYPAVLGVNGKFDMGTIDILRGRELRVPRFNDFRRVFGLPPYKSFEELAGHHPALEAIKKVYSNDIEKVDTMVGTLVEQKTEGFLFSQTVYALFIHQTQRRIEADRFLTEDLTEKTYTKEGLNWVQTASFKTVISRHFPSLANHISVKNAFFGWDRTDR